MLEDMDFIKSCDVPGPTKEAIRAIILYKSEVSPEDKVVDCGCGTGGITCEFAQRAGEVISIDTNPEAIEITGKNLKKFGLGDNVTLINDNGANALKDIENIDIADKTPGPEYTVSIKDEYSALVKKAKAELSDFEFSVFRGCIRGVSKAQIAKEQNVDVKSVNNAVFRIRAKLK